MSHNAIRTNVVEIRKEDCITRALKRYVEQQNPNSVISDGKITLSEWNATIDKLIEINNKRKSENKPLIFRGGNDKTDYHKNLVVCEGDKIEFTESEMNELYNTMGVSIKKDVNTAKKNNTPNVEQQKQTTAQQNATVTNNTKKVQEKSTTVVQQTRKSR